MHLFIDVLICQSCKCVQYLLYFTLLV